MAVPEQLPLAQTSPVVQALASLQLAVLFECVQLPPVQASFVHGFPSLQSPWARHSTQAPATQWVAPPPQLTQLAPAAPHWESDVPGAQLLPSRQPAQQAPPWHRPAAGPTEQLVPFVSLAGRAHSSIRGVIVCWHSWVARSQA